MSLDPEVQVALSLRVLCCEFTDTGEEAWSPHPGPSLLSSIICLSWVGFPLAYIFLTQLHWYVESWIEPAAFQLSAWRISQGCKWFIKWNLPSDLHWQCNFDDFFFTFYPLFLFSASSNSFATISQLLPIVWSLLFFFFFKPLDLCCKVIYFIF